MADPTDDEVREDIRRVVTSMVASGFKSRADIVQAIEDVAGDADDPEPFVAFGMEELNAEMTRQQAREATWSGPSDCDLLDQAFADLEQSGIVARQDFTCCGTCGVAEIGDEIDKLEESGTKARGYTFYHTQDTESAVEGYGLYLNYGDVEGTKEGSAAIGREIASKLQSLGLKVDWDGALSKRIGVKLTWRRRFRAT